MIVSPRSIDCRGGFFVIKKNMTGTWHVSQSMRAYHDQALIDEFRRRGIDTTAVTGRNTISFAHPIRYDLPDNKLIAIG